MSSDSCIACGYPVSHPYFYPAHHPLSVMSLCTSSEESRAMPRFPMRFNICARCGHIFNTAFSYENVPYESRSNLMYNSGSGWQTYIGDLLERVDCAFGLEGKLCVEIGCGDGGFLSQMQRRFRTRCIGFEPSIDQPEGSDLEIYRDYFLPERDLARFKPDFLICRHVLEHLENPLSFVTHIAYWANRLDVRPVFLVEVPRIDKAVAQERVNDYLYEHVSNFSDLSFAMMFELAGFEMLEQRADYGEEVIVGLLQPREDPSIKAHARLAERSHRVLPSRLRAINRSLLALREQGEIALWGGTGKSSAFMNMFELNAEAFPIVVDSDPRKCGFFVPGTGQKIRPPTYLHEHPVESIVITSQWRARDIYHEINARQIPHRACYAVVDEGLRAYRGEEI